MEEIKPNTSALSADKDPQHRKMCTICSTPCEVLVRCQIDDSGQWHFVCPGTCWKHVSGGRVDGDDEHPNYRYGGMWKNKHEAVSAKKPKRKAKQSQADDEPGLAEEHRLNGEENMDVWMGSRRSFTKNDRVRYDGKVWVCRKSHTSEEGKPPDRAHSLWKEQVESTDTG